MRTISNSSSPLLKIQIHDIESRLTQGVMSQRPGSCSLVLMERGSGEICSAKDPLKLAANQLVWLPDGVTAQVRTAPASCAIIAVLPKEVISRSLPEGAPGDDLQHYLKQRLTQQGSEAAALDFVKSNLMRMRQEIYSPQPGTEQILTHLCSLVFLQIWRNLYKAKDVRPVPKSVVDRFFAMERRHRAEHLSVGDYADRIGVSRDRLGAEVRRATNLSPRAYLHQELIREASELLEISSLQVAQIAYRLGFSEPGYFNRFFQRHTGQPPGRYRKHFRRTREEASDSFAAWP